MMFGLLMYLIASISNMFWSHYDDWKLVLNPFMVLTKSGTVVDPQHLEVKEEDISLTKNYCITINVKIISSIHAFILKIQQILESRELKDHCHL